MESNIKLFNNPEFGHVNVVLDEDGKPWFLAKEIAILLGYTNPSKAIMDHVRAKSRKCLKYKALNDSLKASLWSGNDFSDKWLVNEFGLYSLIMGSKLESAQKFQDWVYEEVLPSIRKTGSYSLNQQPNAPVWFENGHVVTTADYLLEIGNQMKALEEKVEEQQQENQKLNTWLDRVDKEADRLESELHVQQEIIAEKNNIIAQQHKVVQDAVCYIKTADKRQRINEIVRNASGQSFSAAFSLLYKTYDQVTHQNIRAQMCNRDYQGTQMDYICDEKQDVDLLYELCVKLFYETAERLKEDFARFAPDSKSKCHPHRRK